MNKWILKKRGDIMLQRMNYFMKKDLQKLRDLVRKMTAKKEKQKQTVRENVLMKERYIDKMKKYKLKRNGDNKKKEKKKRMRMRKE